ncbi:hypothetical protein LDENG_00095090 [Lucifuga dentata]|nr:hypothetical protein LDENG_00095090 [Lucifuga dentata]
MLLSGKAPCIKDELATHNLPDNLGSLIELACRVDDRLRVCSQERGSLRPPRSVIPPSLSMHSVPSPPASAEYTEPMQLGHTKISAEERKRRLTTNSCLYCGQSGHFVATFDQFSTLYSPGSILPSECVVAAVQWGIEQVVRSALRQHPDPGNGPHNRLFVPSSVLTQVLEWGHASCLDCHPGGRRSLALISQHFWWPTMKKDVREYVAACIVCTQNKSSNHAPAGLLRPLPIPCCPWSHIAVDFVTGLPSSSGNTVILTIVDCFSKAAHFVPLPKLPSAKETAQLMVFQVFRLHGLPLNIVSDQGPQFSSSFWHSFCRLLGATASLSSGFHPQTNGQMECVNQDLESALSCLSGHNPSSWSDQLPWVEYAHNTLPVSATGGGCGGSFRHVFFPSMLPDLEEGSGSTTFYDVQLQMSG